MRISDWSSDVFSSDLRKLTQAVEVNRLQQRCRLRIDLVRIDPDIPRHRGLVVAHAGDQVQQPQRLFRSLRTRGAEFERRVRHGDRLDEPAAVVEGIYQSPDAGRGSDIADPTPTRATPTPYARHPP